MPQSAYDISNEELIKRLVKAAAAAGVSGSGLVYDVTAGSNSENLHYLMGVMRARLDDAGDPPFMPDQKMRVMREVCIGYNDPTLEKGRTLTIVRVWYVFALERWKWKLQFKEVHPQEGGWSLYEPEPFEVVETAPVAV